MTGSRLNDREVPPGLVAASGPAPALRSAGSTMSRLLRQRAVRLAVAAWCLVNVLVLALTDDPLPFDWPALPPGSAVDRVADTNIAMLEVLLLMVVVCALTRRRRPDVAARAPKRSTARRETVLLLGYGALGLLGGALVARAFGWHPFGWHLAGTLYGTHEHVAAAEAIGWAGYNLIVYALIPLALFRRRYPAVALNLRSTDRRNDLLVIVVVLLIESAVQLIALRAAIFDLTPRQLALGVPLTFGLYLAGAVLPAMIFIYAILVPRYLRLTGSTAATVVLGGLTYTAAHAWDAWTVFGSVGGAALSVAFLLLTYTGPGMIKTLLTLRTGNAWVHVWAYHALAPHTLVDTPHLVEALHIR